MSKSSPRESASRGVSSHGTASNYATTAADLNFRRIDGVDTPFLPQFHGGGANEQGPSAVRAFASEIVSGYDVPIQERDVRALCDTLLQVLSAVYEKEDRFNVAMFRAMEECLRQLAPGVVNVEDKMIILTHGNGRAGLTTPDGRQHEYEYAAGLARETSIPPENGCIVKSVARTDHAWVMYRRPAKNERMNANWEVWRVLAVVDFKRGFSGWKIPRSNGEGGNVDADALVLSHKENGPLARVIMYAIAHAAPGISSLGELPHSIPFAVIQCMTEESRPLPTGWVHGNLLTPEACGERYSFNVDAYGPIQSPYQSNGAPLAAYLDVMTKGVQIAVRWLQTLRQPRPEALPTPHPLSGRILRFGNRFDPTLTRFVDLKLLATPVLNYCADGDRNYSVHQGELFRATVDLDSFRRNLTTRDDVYWCLDAYPKHSEVVLIKVTSQACFNLLIPIQNALLYSVQLWWENTADVRAALSGSLYGFYQTTDSCGLVYLLPDLRSQGYASLPHGDGLDAAEWGALWNAFGAVVRDVLVPLARHNIVHSDIRIGHDFTANLLYNKDFRSMRLIDLDSLCAFKVLMGLPKLTDLRYLSADKLPGPLKDAKATGFVLGQVLCAAEVWLGAIKHDAVRANDAVKRALRRPPRATAAFAALSPGGAEVGRSPHANDAILDGGNGSIFDGSAFDSEGNFNAEVTEDLICAALDRYQAMFGPQPPPPPPGIGDGGGA